MVTAQRSPSRLDQSGRSVDVITQAQLQAMPVNSLVEALNYAAGVEIRSRGPMGIQADPRIRGGRFNQVLVLLNGIRMNDPQTGHHQLNLPLDLVDVQRIEIIRGPAARVYGPNAFSGAINIITRQPEDSLEVSANARYGSHQAYRLAALAGGALGSTRHRISASRMAHDGYRPITDQQQNNVLYQGKPGERWRVLAGWNERDFGANSFYSTRFPDQRERTETLFGGIQWQGDSAWRPQVQAYIRRHDDRFALRIDPQNRQVNQHTTYAYGLEGRVHQSWAGGLTALGMDLRRTAIESSNLGNHANHQANGYIEHAIWWMDRFKTVGGALLHLHEEQTPSIHPGLDMVWMASPAWRVLGSINRALRNPTYTERFYEDPANVGNPDLESETAWSGEVGVRRRQAGGMIQLALFRRWGRNIIDWNRADSRAAWRATNLAELDFWGVEGQWQAVRPFGWSWLSQLRLNATAMDAQRSIGNRMSRSALSHLSYQASSLAAFAIGPQLRATLSGVWRQPQERAGYALAHLRLSYRWRGFTLEGQVQNLADKRYEAYPGVRMPGRWLWTGLRYDMGHARDRSD